MPLKLPPPSYRTSANSSRMALKSASKYVITEALSGTVGYSSSVIPQKGGISAKFTDQIPPGACASRSEVLGTSISRINA